MTHRIIFLFLFGILFLPAQAQEITPTGNLNYARHNHQSTLFRNSNTSVLVAGGENGSTVYSSCELYNTTTKIWSMAASMKQPRTSFTLLQTVTNIYIAAGGRDNDSLGKKSAELYNSSLNTWTSVGNLNVPRYDHAVVILPSGAMMVAGGTTDKTVEVYNSITKTWSYTGSLNKARHHGASMVLLANGKVLITGGTTDGVDEASAELYDYQTGTWTLLSSPLTHAKAFHKSMKLADNRILISGGQNTNGDAGVSKSCDFFDQTSNTFTSGPVLSEGKNACTPFLLYNGGVMVFGIGNASQPSDTRCLEIYNFMSNTWTSQPYTVPGSQRYTITSITSEQVLIAGGETGSGATDKCYTVSQPPYCIAPDLTLEVTGSSACIGSSGTIVIKNSQVGIEYYAYTNRLISDGIFGTGGDIIIPVLSSNLSLGSNTITIRAYTQGRSCYTSSLTNKATIVVTQALPKPVLSLSGAQKICTFDSVFVSVTNGSFASYTWSNNETSPSIWIKSAGSYRVKVGNAQGCLSDFSDYLTLTSQASPTVPFAGYDENIPEGYPLYKLAAVYPTGGTWSGNLVNQYGELDPASITTGSTVTLTYTVTNAQNCRAAHSKKVRVYSTSGTAHRLYVNHLATGANDGSSWINAYTDLQDALKRTDIYVKEIWVAKGTYRPHATNVNASFILQKRVNLYGSFNGTETSLAQRDLKNNITILSGEIGAAGLTDNIKNIVIACNADGELNGFRIMHGAGRLAPFAYTIVQGGGIYAQGGKLTMVSCWFSNNYNPFYDYSDAGWGQFYFYSCVFTGNKSDQYAACIEASNACFVNCTFAGNYNPIKLHYNSFIVNSIIWGNTSAGGAYCEDDYPNNYAYNCMNEPIVCRFENYNSLKYAANNNAGPDFTDADGADNIYGTLDDDVSLKPGSYAINAGTPDTTSLPVGALYYLGNVGYPYDYNLPAYDLVGQPRFYDHRIDLGAIEYQQVQPRFYVNKNATGLNNGSSWTDAYTDLQSAITNAVNGTKIWVAKGTYYPTATTGLASRDFSFCLKYNMEIYGGFSGNETNLSQRNVTSNPTILSGDIGIAGDSSDNSYTVVFNSLTTKRQLLYYTPLIDTTTVLDGFTIEKGTGQIENGDLMRALLIHNVDATPVIRNCTFQNTNSHTGPLIYNNNYSTYLNSTVSYINCVFKNNHLRLEPGTVLYNSPSSSMIVKGCYFYKNSGFRAGSAIDDLFLAGLFPGTPKVEISDCTFEENKSTSRSTVTSKSGLLKNNTFINNFGKGSDTDYSSILILGDSARVEDCRFINNRCEGYQNGIVYMHPSSNVIFIDNTTFTGNESVGSTPLFTLKNKFFISNTIYDQNKIKSGNPVIKIDDNANGEFKGCTFKNHLNKDAALLYMKSGKLRILESTFENNKDSLARYSCIYKSNGELHVYKTLFFKNEGSLLYCHGLSTTTVLSSKFISNVNGYGSISTSDKLIVNNSMFIHEQGPAIYNAKEAIVANCSFHDISGPVIAALGDYTIKNNIIGHNRYFDSPVSTHGGDIATISNCIIQTQYAVPGTDNLINVDPQYKDINGPDQLPGTKDDNLQLQCNSIAGDRGALDTTGLYLHPFDLDGNPRIAGSRIDIGAYESSAPEIPLVVNDSICGSGTVVLALQTHSANSYKWYPTASSSTVLFTNETNSFTLNPNQRVEYYISATNSMGCESTRKKVFGRSDPHPAQPLITGENSYCEGASTALYCDQLQVTYEWSSAETTRSIAVSAAGSRTVKTTNIYGCESPVSNVFEITETASPDRPLITVLGTSLESSGNGTAYEWSLNNSILSQYTGPVIQSAANGNYKVRYQNEEGCYSDYSEPIALFVTGNTKTELAESISLFPVPVSEALNVTIHLPLAEHIQVLLLNTNGEVVMKDEFSDTIYEKQWNVAALPKGVYILQVISSDQLSNKVFVIQ